MDATRFVNHVFLLGFCLTHEGTGFWLCNCCFDPFIGKFVCINVYRFHIYHYLKKIYDEDYGAGR